jgi:hypothetical protein
VAGPDVHDVETNLAEVAVELFAPGSVEATLARIVQLAAATVESCDAAGILVLEGDALRVAAASSPLADELDRAQIDASEGPCVDAALIGQTIYADDLTTESRWPRFTAQAVDAGARTVLAFSLAGTRASALNLYAQLPAAFGAADRAQGQLYATLARLAIDSAEERAAGEIRAGNLQAALRTRELIGQAQGILMERERITAEQAFAVLRRASQHMNMKVHQIAQSLVETGEAPDTGPTPLPGG